MKKAVAIKRDSVGRCVVVLNALGLSSCSSGDPSSTEPDSAANETTSIVADDDGPEPSELAADEEPAADERPTSTTSKSESDSGDGDSDVARCGPSSLAGLDAELPLVQKALAGETADIIALDPEEAATADPSMRYSAFHIWVADDCIPMVELAIESGVDVNSVSFDGQNAAHFAASDEVLQRLIDEGVNLEAGSDSSGTLPIELFAFQGRADLLAVVIESGTVQPSTLARGLQISIAER